MKRIEVRGLLLVCSVLNQGLNWCAGGVWAVGASVCQVLGILCGEELLGALKQNGCRIGILNATLSALHFALRKAASRLWRTVRGGSTLQQCRNGHVTPSS